MFLDSVALKSQLTLKWSGPDILKENCPMTKAQCVMGEKYYGHTYTQPITFHVKIYRIKKHPPFKEVFHVPAGRE